MKEAVAAPVKITRKKIAGCGRVKRSGSSSKSQSTGDFNICANASCRLRKAGCKGFEGCPGYKGRG